MEIAFAGTGGRDLRMVRLFQNLEVEMGWSVGGWEKRDEGESDKEILGT